MRRCQQCGHNNEPDDVYCANCGVRLSEEPVSFSDAPPAAGSPAPTDQPGGDTDRSVNVDDEWKMSSLGPPPARRRRRWLWVLIGLLLACVLICCAGGIFLSTDRGMDWLEGVATEASQRATEQAE